MHVTIIIFVLVTEVLAFLFDWCCSFSFLFFFQLFFFVFFFSYFISGASWTGPWRILRLLCKSIPKTLNWSLQSYIHTLQGGRQFQNIFYKQWSSPNCSWPASWFLHWRVMYEKIWEMKNSCTSKVFNNVNRIVWCTFFSIRFERTNTFRCCMMSTWGLCQFSLSIHATSSEWF